MPRPRDTAARKPPRQQRSRETVAALLEATAKTLMRDGFERTSTNRIADAAGVSVGSLDQYFLNKRALVRALYERHVADAERIRPPVLQAPPRPDGPPLREVMRAAVEWHLAAHAVAPRLHEELTAHASNIVGAKVVREFERMHEARVRLRLEAHRDEIAPQDLDLAAFLVATCLEAVSHAAACRRPELLESDRLGRELAALLLGYLERPRAAKRGTRRRVIEPARRRAGAASARRRS